YEMSNRANVRSNSVDGIDVVLKNTQQRTGMFMLVRKSDGAIDKLRIIDLSGDVRVHDRKVYWLGKPDSDESATLLLHLSRTSTSTQVRKDAIFWLGQEISRVSGDRHGKSAS